MMFGRLKLSSLFVGIAALACASSPAPIVYGPSDQSVTRYPTPTSTTNAPSSTSQNFPTARDRVVESPISDPLAPAHGPFQPNAELRFCGAGFGSNIPPADEEKFLRRFKPVIVVNDVVMATIPANDVCLSSGFGMRNGRPHEGIDVTSRPAGTVYSAAPGVILEAGFSRGYGYEIVIAHGNGVFSRYAHLEFIESGLVAGTELGFGVPLGRMGKTGNATGIHLHFEILTGDYNNPRRSNGLEAHDPFSFPAWSPIGTPAFP